MKSRVATWTAILLLAWPAAGLYKQATPGYRYEFPRDHFNHEDFQTEWWYYTGNLTASDGQTFGFELTFFRQGVNHPAAQTGAWDIRDVYLAHLALSDLNGEKFYHAERINRAGPGIAGVNEAEKRIWNGNWSARWNGEQQQLDAVEDRLSLSLRLAPQKEPVVHGENGISQKAAGAGHASHYISLTRLKTEGTIRVAEKTYAASGLAWMDHEFFTEQLAPDQAGWDWFSVQLGDNTELMLYRLRKKDGSVDPYSAGTFVDAKGHATHLRSMDFVVVPTGERWKSPETSAIYPVAWSIAVPALALQLNVETSLKAQEFASHLRISPNYWEGAMRFEGKRQNTAVHGVGYLEMVGYDAAVALAAGDRR